MPGFIRPPNGRHSAARQQLETETEALNMYPNTTYYPPRRASNCRSLKSHAGRERDTGAVCNNKVTIHICRFQPALSQPLKPRIFTLTFQLSSSILVRYVVIINRTINIGNPSVSLPLIWDAINVTILPGVIYNERARRDLRTRQLSCACN